MGVLPAPSVYRRLPVSGDPVNTYEEFVVFLKAKHPAIRTGKLAFESRSVTKCADVAARARSVVLYMLPEDYLYSTGAGT